jgi:hypothetical protein
MAVRMLQVMVDQWGHTPGFAKGTTVLINDDDPEKMLYSVDGRDPLPFVGDVGWAIDNGSVVEVDESGQPVGSARTGLPFPTGRLPVGDEKALDRGDPSGEAVPVPSGSAEDGELTMAPNPTPDADVDEAELTPAQKAARTRAANAERDRGES